jgi:hypothetical protein
MVDDKPGLAGYDGGERLAGGLQRPMYRPERHMLAEEIVRR